MGIAHHLTRRLSLKSSMTVELETSPFCKSSLGDAQYSNPNMSSPKPLTPFRKAWLNWKSLHLPWRKRFLVGTFPSIPPNQTQLSNIPSPTLQASISKATPSGNSVTRCPRTSIECDASCSIRARHITARSRSARSGTNGSSMCVPTRPRSRSRVWIWFGRGISRCWPRRRTRGGQPKAACWNDRKVRRCSNGWREGGWRRR